MRSIALGAMLLAACDFEGTITCPGGYVCPSHLACVEPATYQHCALPENLDQCHGMADYTACNYFSNSGAGFEGACRGGVCIRCTDDLEGCNVGAWTAMTPVSEDLNAIYVAGRGDAYAAGAGGTVFHYDGLAWSALTKLAAPLVSIAPDPGAGDILVLDNSGHSFEVATAGMPVTQITAPAGMTAIGGSLDASYGVGIGFIARMGNGWMVEVMDGTKVFDAVTVASTGQAFAAGNAGAIDVFDGNAWNVAPAQTSQTLKAIWAADGEHAFAVGTFVGTQSYATIVRLDPSGWSANQSAVPPVNLLAVWGSGASDVYTGGENGTLWHYTTDWSLIPPLTQQTIKAIGGSGPGDVFAVGNAGTILHYSQ